MDIARDVFAKRRVIPGRLEKAGFTVSSDDPSAWQYSETFMGGDLTCIVRVSRDGSVTAKAVDSVSLEEYLPMNVEAFTGSYVGEAREEYRALLEKISEKCFDEMPFISDQANRISGRIHDELGADPEFPFSKEKDSDAAVFRHRVTGKWFAIVMTIKRIKLDHDAEGKAAGEMINVMNVKIDPDELSDLLTEPGLYRCYHMNKKMWISIALDDTCPDDRIMELIKKSFELTKGGSPISGEGKRYWLIPSNPAHFDVAKGFRESGNDTLAWHHRINVQPGDIVYIYQTEPVASIMFECEVLESFLPRPESWSMIAPSSKYRMTLKLIRSFRKGEYPRSFMNEHGVAKTVRGQRSAPHELVEALEKTDI